VKDAMTLDFEREHGKTKRESAVERLDPLVEQYVRATPGESGEPVQTILEDLLADLMHWSAAQDPEEEVDFNRALSTAQMHYDHEHDDEDGEDG